MKDKIEYMNESEEKGYYFSVIKQAKELITLSSISEEYRLLTKEKLLSCLDICSKTDCDNIKTTNEILDILSDEKLFNFLSDKDKSLIYANLGDNYFLLGDMELSLDSYKKSFNYGNIEIYKEIIYIEIFLRLSGNEEKIIKEGNIAFSSIINDFKNNKENLDFGNEIEVDLGEFFVGGFDFIDNPNSLQDYIYNLELTEIKWITEIQSYTYSSKKEYDKSIAKMEEILSEQYMYIAKAVNHIDYIYVAHGNMIKRLGGEDIEYLEYGKQLKDFLETGFQIVNSYIQNGKSNEGLDVLEFIIVNGFTNLSLVNKDFIAINIKKIVNDKFDDIDKDRLNSILLNIANNTYISYKLMVIIGDIFLKIGRFGNAYSFYYFALKGNLDLEDKFKELLELMIFEGNFLNNEEINVIDSKITISSLLEKINDGKKLNLSDLDNIRSICNLV